jgi:hypothetical protein
MQVIEREMARAPSDADVLVWHARILTWSGHLTEAEAEYLNVLKLSDKDPDIWQGLANVYLRQRDTQKALWALDAAIQLDPKRPDLHAARGRALRAAGENKQARLEFHQALVLDPHSYEARNAMRSFETEAKHELRLGEENDVFNFAGPNYNESVSLMSRWSPQWASSVTSNTYQRSGVLTEKFIGSVTARLPTLGAITGGAAAGHDSGVIPKTEAFFDIDRGLRIQERGWVRGIEFVYGQHWYWYETARILTLNGAAILYFPRDWSVTFAATGARSAFSGAGVEWRPAGSMRLGFPLTHWNTSHLSGTVLFAAGSENFASSDQVGRFASQTYGGGIRFEYSPRFHLGFNYSYQKRTQNRTDSYTGVSYGVRF